MKLLINRELTDLNNYIKATRSNRFLSARIKRDETYTIYWMIKEQGLKPMKTPVLITCHFYCKDKRKDKDNILFAQKFILDALVNAGIIPSDGWDYVDIGKPTFHIDPKPHVEVDIETIL